MRLQLLVLSLLLAAGSAANTDLFGNSWDDVEGFSDLWNHLNKTQSQRRREQDSSACLQVGLYLGKDLEAHFGNFWQQVAYFKGMLDDISNLFEDTWGISLQMRKAWQRDWGRDGYELFQDSAHAIDTLMEYFEYGHVGALSDINILLSVTSHGRRADNEGAAAEGIAIGGGIYVGGIYQTEWGTDINRPAFGLMVGVTKKNSQEIYKQGSKPTNHILFAHEIAHLLGAEHTHETDGDWSTPLDWCGIDGGVDPRCNNPQPCNFGSMCPGHYGTIMSYCDAPGCPGSEWGFHDKVIAQVSRALDENFVDEVYECQNCACFLECEDYQVDGTHRDGQCVGDSHMPCGGVDGIFESDMGGRTVWHWDMDSWANNQGAEVHKDDDELGVYCHNG